MPPPAPVTMATFPSNRMVLSYCYPSYEVRYRMNQVKRG
jgi:hypothetical protein